MEQKARRTLSDDVRWVRGRARFEDGSIVLDPATLRDYSALEEGEDAPWKLAAIRRPQDAVDFARRFGLLHHGRETELREPWSDWESTALHIHSILFTVTQLRASGRGDDPEATDYIRKITSEPAWHQLWQAEAQDDRERRIQVGVWVAEQVSSGLADTGWGLRAQAELFGGNRGAPDLFLYSPRPSDLLGWIYYSLAQTLVSAKPMRRCEGCGVMFLVHDDRQRYHDKQCAQRARYHRAAEKRRKQT
jgi:hypothetical protein